MSIDTKPRIQTPAGMFLRWVLIAELADMKSPICNGRATRSWDWQSDVCCSPTAKPGLGE